MLLEEHHFTAPQRASPWLLSLSLASRSEDLQWMGGTFSKGPNDNRELVSTLPVTPRSGRNLLRGLADPSGRVGRRVADCESMWRGLWTLVSRAARGPHRWGDLGKGCDSVGRCSGPKPSPWDLGAPFYSTQANVLFLSCLSVVKVLPEILQETDQILLRHTLCNKKLQAHLGYRRTLVRKGMICGYHEDLKSPCKVS